MLKTWLFILFIISSLLSGHGHGRITTAVRSSDVRSPPEPQKDLGEEREMMEMTMDYKEPGANTNPWSGLIPPPPPPSH